MDDTTLGGVRALYSALLAAWNRQDASAYAALLADAATVIGFDGSRMSGPDEVRSTLEAIFADHPTGSYVARVLDVREVGDGLALLLAESGVVPRGADDLLPELGSVQTMLAQRSRSGWRAVLFQNTPAQHHGRPDRVEQHTAALRQLLADGVTIG